MVTPPLATTTLWTVMVAPNTRVKPDTVTLALTMTITTTMALTALTTLAPQLELRA